MSRIDKILESVRMIEDGKRVDFGYGRWGYIGGTFIRVYPKEQLRTALTPLQMTEQQIRKAGYKDLYWIMGDKCIVQQMKLKPKTVSFDSETYLWHHENLSVVGTNSLIYQGKINIVQDWSGAMKEEALTLKGTWVLPVFVLLPKNIAKRSINPKTNLQKGTIKYNLNTSEFYVNVSDFTPNRFWTGRK